MRIGPILGVGGVIPGCYFGYKKIKGEVNSMSKLMLRIIATLLKAGIIKFQATIDLPDQVIQNLKNALADKKLNGYELAQIIEPLLPQIKGIAELILRIAVILMSAGIITLEAKIDVPDEVINKLAKALADKLITGYELGELIEALLPLIKG